MHEGEDVGAGTVFAEGLNDGVVGHEISWIGTLEGTRLDVEDVNEDPNGGENMRLLGGEVGLCEGVLAKG